ncbi:hypothetical protein JXM67_13310 [candidate division WOR-3 bacterium]|nr:hypothetical protein [candidate division WOR-3 bacterium]
MPVDRLDHESWFTHSPCWSNHGLKVYYLSQGNDDSYSDVIQIWSIDLSSMTPKKMIDNSEDFLWMDVSHEREICVVYSLDNNDELWLFDLEDSASLGEIKTSEHQPKFSSVSDSIVYFGGGNGIGKYNLADSSVEKILSAESGYIHDFAPGPGDTLFAIGDTIYNINTGEVIPIDIPSDEINRINWNPANPQEVVIATHAEGGLLLFNLEEGI